MGAPRAERTGAARPAEPGLAPKAREQLCGDRSHPPAVGFFRVLRRCFKCCQGYRFAPQRGEVPSFLFGKLGKWVRIAFSGHLSGGLRVPAGVGGGGCRCPRRRSDLSARRRIVVLQRVSCGRAGEGPASPAPALLTTSRDLFSPRGLWEEDAGVSGGVSGLRDTASVARRGGRAWGGPGSSPSTCALSSIPVLETSMWPTACRRGCPC